MKTPFRLWASPALVTAVHGQSTNTTWAPDSLNGAVLTMLPAGNATG